MSVSRWIYEPFYSATSEADRLFDELSPRHFHSGRTSIGSTSDSLALRPKLDLYENPDNNLCTATFELPGFKKEDVKIDVNNNLLTVTGQTSTSVEKDDRGYAIHERRFGKASRSVQLPQGIKHNDIKAALENGVLTVTFPKSAPESAPQKITIS